MGALRAKERATIKSIHADDGSALISIADACRRYDLKRTKVAFAAFKGDLAVYTYVGAMVFFKVRDLEYWRANEKK